MIASFANEFEPLNFSIFSFFVSLVDINFFNSFFNISSTYSLSNSFSCKTISESSKLIYKSVTSLLDAFIHSSIALSCVTSPFAYSKA